MLRGATGGDLHLAPHQVSALRLKRHHLDARAPRESLVEVVRDVCGVQAQLMTAAHLALQARVQGLTKKDIEQALWRDRSLVKVWCMRRTVHLVPADMLAVYLAALKRRALEAEQKWLAKHGVTQSEIDEMITAIADSLAGGSLSRKELAGRVVERVGSKARRWIEHGWGGAVKQASLRGLVCFGPNEGQEITFTKLEQWMPSYRDIPTDEAEVSLLKAYLHSYGPATLGDFSSWSGMTVKDAAPILERLGSEAIRVLVGSSRKWLLQDDAEDALSQAHREPNVRLLPSFDPYMLGHKDKDHLVEDRHYKKVYRKAGWLSPVVLVGGRVAGTWLQKRQGKHIKVEVRSFGRLSPRFGEMVEKEIAELRRFYEVATELSILQATQ